MWFSTRDGLRSQAQSGGGQADVYAMFLTQKAFDDFNMSKEEAALAKDIEKAAKGDSTKKDSTKKKEVPKDNTVTIEWDGLDTRKAKLTIHSSSCLLYTSRCV